MEAIFTFFLILFLIILLLRLLFPIILRTLIKRMSGFDMKNNPNNQKNKTTYKSGKTTITSHGEEHSEVPKDLGEYTDYEEIKDKE